MKKRLLITIMAVILILSFTLAGCNLFTVNAERDGDQVVATVKHNGLVGEITKLEFVTYFNNYFQTYNQYFQWDVETAGENFIAMLAREKMTLILAVEQLAANNLDKSKFNAINSANVSKSDATKGYGVYSAYLLSLLNPDEQKYVKEQTNKIFKDSYDEEIETQLENDKIKAEEDEDTDDKYAKDPRPVKEEKEDTEFKEDASITQADADKVQKFFDEFKPNEKSTQYEKDAYRKQERALENTYRTYEYYLAKQAEARITAKYQDTFEDLSDISADVTAQYKKVLDEQKKSHKTADGYKSAVEGSSTLIYHNGRYVKLKSILLQFTDEQKAALTYINNALGSNTDNQSMKEYKNKLREALVFGIIAGYNEDLEIPDALASDLLGLVVYESNPDYDATKPASDPAKPDSGTNYPYYVNEHFNANEPVSETNQRWKSVPFLDVIARLGAEIKEIETTAGQEYDEKYGVDNDAVGRKMYINQKKAEKFEEWIYRVNDDPGMFEGKEYSETAMGNSSSYVTEFTALVRQLLNDNNTAGSVMINTDGNTAVSGNIVKNSVKVDKLDGKLWKKENVDVYTDTENNISFVINEFGVHIVMLTTVPVDFAYNQEGVHFTVEENADFDKSAFANYTADELAEIVKANSFYTFNENAYVGFDEKTGKAITVREQFEKSLKDTFDNTMYSTHSRKLFEMYGEKFFDGKDDKTPSSGYENFKFELSLNKSVYNGVIGPAKKSYNG